MKRFTAQRQWLAEQGERLDAAGYASGGLSIRDRITRGAHSWDRLGRVSTLSMGSRFARTYVRGAPHGVAFVGASDMVLADFVGVPFISRKRTEELDALTLEAGWTLLSRSGTIGRTAYVRGEMEGMAGSDDIIRLVPLEDVVRPGYLFAFMTSWQAQAMIQQKVYGSVVQHIEPHHIADMPVPLPEGAMQERIHGLVAGAAAARTEASRLLDEAAAYFDGLAGPMPSAHDHARASGTVRRSRLSGRLDAFHHVGWAVEGGTLDGTPIGEIGEVSRPGIFKRIWVKRGVPFVSGVDAFQVRVPYRQLLMRAEVERSGCAIQEAQVLVQRSGQRYGLLGRPAYVGKRLGGWAGSEHLMRITCRRPEVVSRVFAFLHSRIGHRCVLRTSYGTSIPELNPEGVAGVRVPPMPETLADGVQRALALRERADEDEQQAIREVEAWLG